MQKIGAELTMSQQCANDISQLLSQRHATAKLVACVQFVCLTLRTGGEP